MALFSFGRRRDPAVAAAADRIAGLVRTMLGLDADAGVTVSEIACGDPACGGAETIILVMLPGRRTQAAKVKRPMALATDAEVRAALDGLAL
jgi:hypothetical protein